MKYYSTQRPVGPGTYPKEYGIEEIHNFDTKTFCDDIGREAWGYIITSQVIPDDVLEKWELTSAESRTWWCVVTTVYDDGRVTAHITDSQESVKQPESHSQSTSRRDIYSDWFESREEAEKIVEEAKRA